MNKGKSVRSAATSVAGKPKPTRGPGKVDKKSTNPDQAPIAPRPRSNSGPSAVAVTPRTLREVAITNLASENRSADVLAASTPTQTTPPSAESGNVGDFSIRSHEVSGESEDMAIAEVNKSIAGITDDLPIREIPVRALRLHASAKKALESARNLKREIRDVAIESLQELYNLILRLADSRSRHEAAAERLRADRAKEVAFLEGKHSSALTKQMEVVGELVELNKKIRQEVEAVRGMFVYEIANSLEPLSKSSSAVSDKLERVEKTVKTEVVQALRNIPVAPSGHSSATVTHNLSGPIDDLKNRFDLLQKTVESRTYAEATKAHGPRVSTSQHTLIISSTDKLKTSQQVLEEVTGKVDARQLGVGVERLRKAKNQKVVLSCSTKRETDLVRRAINESAANLVVSDAARRLPQIIIWDVMAVNTDDQIVESLKRQNPKVYAGLGEQERAKVKHRLKARNSLQCHVILEATPALWRRMVEQGRLYVGWQRCRAEERSPLVQCGKCLGFAHSRGACKAELGTEVCAYCAKPGHEARSCPEREASPPRPPVCVNCIKENLGSTGHTAFSDECPVRAKWEAIAKASVAYC